MSTNDVLSESSGIRFLVVQGQQISVHNPVSPGFLYSVALYWNRPSLSLTICWAIDVVQEIPYGKRLPATSGRTPWETVLRLKISPSHLMLAPRTGKCVWRPLVLFLYLPVTHTAAAQAEPTRHAVWLWQAAFNRLWMYWIYSYIYKCAHQRLETRRKTLLPLSYLCSEWIHTLTQINPSVQLTGTQENVTMNVARTLKQNLNKQQPCSHTSLQQDVLRKQTCWSAYEVFIYLRLWHYKTA